MKTHLLAAIEAHLIALQCEVESIGAMIAVHDNDPQLPQRRAILLGTIDRLKVRQHQIKAVAKATGGGL